MSGDGQSKGRPPVVPRRVPLRRAVSLKFKEFRGFVNEVSANISTGGMFIRTDSPKPPGAIFDFELLLEDETTLIHGIGQVVWIRDRAESADHPAGMGIRFLTINDAGRELIERLVAEHEAKGGERFNPETEPPHPPPPEPPALARAELEDEAPASSETEAGDDVWRPEPPPELIPEPPSAPRTGPATPSPLPQDAARSLSEVVEAAWRARPPAATPLEVGSEARPVEMPEPEYYRARTKKPDAASRPLIVGAIAVVAVAVAVIAYVGLRPASEPRPSPAATGALTETPKERRDAGGEELQALPGEGEGRADERVSEIPSGEEQIAAVDETEGAPQEEADARPAADSEPNPEETPLPEPAASPAAPEAPMSRVLDIRATESEGETVVVLTTDGSIAESRYGRWVMGGESPRVLLKLYGVREGYPRTVVAVGTPQVKQVRVGYHSGEELHVVIDLAGAGVRLGGIEVDGRKLRVTLRGS